MAPTLEVLRVRKHAPTPSSFVVFILGFTLESLKEFGGASINKGIFFMNICRGPLTFVFVLKSLHNKDIGFL